MNLVRKFIKTSGIYFLGKALSFVVTFVMLRVYTSNVSNGGYGYYELVVSYIQSLIPFVFIEIWSGMLRRSLFHKEDSKKNSAIATSFVFVFIGLILYCAGYLAFACIFDYKAKLIIFFYSISYLFYSYFCILARALKKNRLFAISGIVGSLGNALIGSISIYVFHLDFEAIFLSLIANYTIQSVVVFIFTRSWRFFKPALFDKQEASQLLKFCLPLALNTLVNYAYTGFYKTIVNARLGEEVLGLYGVSIKFAAIITFIGSIFHLAWQEVSYSLSESDNKTYVYTKGLWLFGFVIAIACVAIVPLIKIVFPLLIGPAYSEAAKYVPYYYLYVYFFMINGFLYNVFSAENKTTMLFVGKLIGTAVLISLIYILLPRLNVIAIPISVVAASFLEYVFLRLYAMLKFKIKFFNYSLILTVVLYAVGCFLYWKCGLVENIAWLFISVAIASVVAFLFNRSFIKNLLSQFKKETSNNNAGQ